MNQSRYLSKLLQGLKKNEYTKFKRYLQYQSERNYSSIAELCDQLRKSAFQEQNTDEWEHLNDATGYRKLYDLRKMLEKFILDEILPEEQHLERIKKVQLLRYLREINLMDDYREELEDLFQLLDSQSVIGTLRSFSIDYLNELRKFFYYKYYQEKNYRPNAIQENYLLLVPAEKLIRNQYKQQCIFFDFTLKAAHKIEADTLQKDGPGAFKPKFLGIEEYFHILDDEDLPLLHKTLILDIIDGQAGLDKGEFNESIERLLSKHLQEATAQEKYNLMVCLIVSDKIDPIKKDHYYQQLLSLKPVLNPGVLHSYVVEHLAERPELARKEFERLSPQAQQDSPNDLKIIEGVLLTRESNYAQALKVLNQVTLYQQDKAYFDVNLCLLKCHFELGDMDIASSILQKLNVYYYKYKDSLRPATEETYRNQIAYYKKML
jgi:hypothetical protein